MATITLALDGTTYPFQGWGVAPAIYEKGRPLANYAGDLGTSAWADYLADIGLFTWLRMFVCGGEHYRESATGKNYPAKKQARLLKELFASAPFRVIISPFSAPSSCMSDGDQDTLRDSGTALTTGQSITSLQAFVANDTNWQAWLDSIAQGIKAYQNAGANIEIFETPNEYGHTSGHSNYWLSYLTSSDAVSFVNKVWLGTGLSGGGVKARFPQLEFLNGYAVSGGGPAAIDGDGTTGPEVTFDGHGNYANGISVTGLVNSVTGSVVISEFGPATSGVAETPTLELLRTAHQSVVYVRSHCACMWTSLRDTTAKAVADGRGVSYSARGLFNMTTASGTYARTPLWWGLKPFLLAAGRGSVDAFCAAHGTALGADANFNPATGVFFTAFKRSDGGYGCVYLNYSGSDRSDTIDFTIGGGDAALTGTRRDYQPHAGSGQEGSESAISTTSGSITLTSVPTSTIVLLQLEESP